MKRSRGEIGVRVWVEPGWEDGKPLSWRAAAFKDGKYASRIGAGSSRDEALAEWRKLWLADQARDEGEWLTLAAALAKPGVP